MGINRSTVNRWLSGDGENVLVKAEQLMSLAAILDLDPVLLWEYDVDSFPEVCDCVLGALESGNWGKLVRALQFVKQFIRPTTEWPPGSIASRYPIKTWQPFEFSHDPKVKRDFYAPVLIRDRGSKC
jgi:hypothetical protein